MRNVSKTHSKKGAKRRAIFRLALFAALFLGGCNSTRESFCREMPSAINEVQSFQLALVTLVPDKVTPRRGPKRKIASVVAVSEDRSAQIESSRDAWLEWTEKALKRAQWGKDALEHEKQGKKALPLLKDASLSLVSLHGFIEQRKWKKALAELQRVEKNLKKAETSACVDSAEPTRAPKK